MRGGQGEGEGEGKHQGERVPDQVVQGEGKAWCSNGAGVRHSSHFVKGLLQVDGGFHRGDVERLKFHRLDAKFGILGVLRAKETKQEQEKAHTIISKAKKATEYSRKPKDGGVRDRYR